jgi:hypothetical protein
MPRSYHSFKAGSDSDFASSWAALYTEQQMRDMYAAGRAAAVAELQPAYSAMQERAEKAEAALARIFAAFDEGTAKVVQGLRAAEHEGQCSLRWPATLGTKDDLCDCREASPVAWMVDGRERYFYWIDGPMLQGHRDAGHKITPLYAAPK